jgi:hypothetical protein
MYHFYMCHDILKEVRLTTHYSIAEGYSRKGPSNQKWYCPLTIKYGYNKLRRIGSPKFQIDGCQNSDVPFG